MTSETPLVDPLLKSAWNKIAELEAQLASLQRDNGILRSVIEERNKREWELVHELSALRAEVDRCHERLEIDRVYQGDGTERVTVPYEERKNIPDGISCRNETIRLLDEALDRLRADKDQAYLERNHLVAALARLYPSWRDDFWGWGPNRDGKNMLDKLWMEIRAELLAARPKS